MKLLYCFRKVEPKSYPNLQQRSIFKFDHEVQTLWYMICDPGIPAKSYDEITLMALDKTYLNHDLANFSFTAWENCKVLYNPDIAEFSK